MDKKTCPACGGKGGFTDYNDRMAVDMDVECPTCEGKGTVPEIKIIGKIDLPCPECNVPGTNKDCKLCGNTRRISVSQAMKRNRLLNQ